MFMPRFQDKISKTTDAMETRKQQVVTFLHTKATQNTNTTRLDDVI